MANVDENTLPSTQNGSLLASNGFSDDHGELVLDSKFSPTRRTIGRPRKGVQNLANSFNTLNGSASENGIITEGKQNGTHFDGSNTSSSDISVGRPRSARRPKPNKVYADFIIEKQKHKSHSKNAELTHGNNLKEDFSEQDISILNGSSKDSSPLKSKAVYNGKHKKRSLQVNGENSVFCVTCGVSNCSVDHNKSPKLSTSDVRKTRSSDNRENCPSVVTNGKVNFVKEVTSEENALVRSPDKSTQKQNLPKNHSARLQKSPAQGVQAASESPMKSRTSQKLLPESHFSCSSLESDPVERGDRSEAVSANTKASDVIGGDMSPRKSVDGSRDQTEYLVGDLLWSKIRGHPFWPCMVSYDPAEGIYKKLKRYTRDSTHTVYHVQYFGDEAVHGWTVPYMILPFEGLASYDGMVKDVEKKAEKLKTILKKKVLAKYAVPPTRRKAWETAIKEAEEAMAMSRAVRKQTLTFEYSVDKDALVHTPIRRIQVDSMGTLDEDRKKQGENKLLPGPNKVSQRLQNLIPKVRRTAMKRKRSISPSSATKTVKSKKQRADNSASPVTPTKVSVSQPTSTPRSNKSVPPAVVNKGKKSVERVSSDTPRLNKSNSIKQQKGSFSAFLSKHIEATKREHPELDEMGVKAQLRIQWQMMTDAQRSRYVNNWDDDEVVIINEEPIPNSQSTTDSMDGASTGQAASEVSSVEEIEATNTASKAERVCPICEKTGANISCSGPCLQSFHFDCLGLMKVPQVFKCDECTSGKPSCFSCKSNEGQVRRCTVISCGKSYHNECLRKYPLTARVDGRSLTCPLHACLSCYIENPKNPRQSKSRLIKCLRCPTAFHMGDSCVSAGSVSVSQSNIICANHFERDSSRQYQSHLNVTWCFICSTGGSLILCDSCPAAFHAECLEIDPPAPEESFFCEDCTLGKHPRYRDIIWVKLGCYRWWPAEVCNLRNIPGNILNMKHSVGEFPVHFFGSHDYYWIHRGRVFLFNEGDKGTRDSMANRSLAKTFQKALEEANEAFRQWTAAKKAKMEQENERCLKPPPFKQIKVNKPVGNVQIHTVDPQLLNRCECDPKSENPCGPEADCLNRMMMVECHPAACRAGDKCENQRFQKRQYITAVPYKSEGRGWGLKTVENIRKGQFVYEYVGDLIDEKECQRRLKKMHEDNETNFYFLTIDNNRIIDAGPKGNNSRFMNHSCQPNCETQKWLVNGDTRVGLFAVEDIPAGTELTFNYNLDCRGNEKTKCACGATNCSGYIGVRPKAITNEDQDKKAREASLKKKKKKAQLLPKHEDECFRCEEGGELVMCDRKGCPKSYHLNCLELAKPPHGRWECPWHHCDVCGRLSVFMCSLCPNSFCREHITNSNLFSTGAGLLICDEHAENELENCTPVLDTVKKEEKQSVKD